MVVVVDVVVVVSVPVSCFLFNFVYRASKLGYRECLKRISLAAPYLTFSDRENLLKA